MLVATSHAIPGRHLLIISCSKTKNSKLRNNKEVKLPALKGYDGKIFLTLRKALREGLGQNVDVLIISAKYGLLRTTDEISYYEERMTRQKALELRVTILAKLNSYINEQDYRKIFVMLGQDYFETVNGLSKLKSGIPIEIIKMEKIGIAQQKLRNLLLKLNSQIVVS